MLCTDDVQQMVHLFFFLFFFKHLHKKWEGEFELLTSALLDMVYNRLSFLLEFFFSLLIEENEQ
jgi:hypothetical protein